MQNTELLAEKRKDLRMVDPRSILIEDTNLRKDYGDIDGLMATIVSNGLQQPVKVQRIKGTETYRLVHGFRRMTAINKAINKGLDTSKIQLIPIMLIENNYDEIAEIVDHFIMNSGLPLTPIEEADGIKLLTDKGLTPKQISERIGKTQAHVSNSLKLANADEKVKNFIREGKINATTVLGIIRENENIAIQVKIIEDSLKKAEESGKTKVTGKTLTGSNSTKTTKTILNEALELLIDELGLADERTLILNKLIKNLDKKCEAKVIANIFKKLSL